MGTSYSRGHRSGNIVKNNSNIVFNIMFISNGDIVNNVGNLDKKHVNCGFVGNLKSTSITVCWELKKQVNHGLFGHLV